MANVLHALLKGPAGVTINDYVYRNYAQTGMDDVKREILLSLWKVHILHHAASEPIIGQWVLRELRRHGYEVSPGTVYPILARMEERGWLRCRVEPDGGLRAKREYSLTKRGQAVLALLRRQVAELYREVVLGDEEDDEAR